MAFTEVTIAHRTDWSDGLWSIQLDATLPALQPGQFINLALDRDGERVKRSYSLASAPGEPPELYLVRVDGGALTPALDRLHPGDTLLMDDRPSGFFTLEHVPPARDLWLLSTGTGLGPFLSMLRSGLLWPRFERVVLVNGARHQTHLGYRQQLTALAEARGEPLSYLPMVSRESPPGCLHGRIPAAIRSGALEHAAARALSPEHSHVLLCGNPAMIQDTLSALAERGLRKHRSRQPGHISTEKYW